MTPKMFRIEIDEDVYNHLKIKAEPFKNPPDSPNSVLRRLLLIKDKPLEIKPITQFPIHVPSTLAQILQVVKIIKVDGLTRNEATKMVAQQRGITVNSVLDKYTRHLEIKAEKFDYLLMDVNICDLKTRLINKFSRHTELIEKSFEDFEKH